MSAIKSQGSVRPLGIPSLGRFPRFGGTGFVAMLCGIAAIGAWVCPSLTEQLFPGYVARFGPAVLLIVGLSFFRAVFRAVGSLFSLGFWCLAIVAVFSLANGSLGIQTWPSVLERTEKYVGQSNFFGGLGAGAPIVSQVSKQSPQRMLPPALPEEAYFPRATTGATDFPNALTRLFKSP